MFRITEIKLNQMILEKKTKDIDGNLMNPTGTVTMEEAHFINHLIVQEQLLNCAETGVAFGASTVAICDALAQLKSTGLEGRHWGADPCQSSDFNNAARAALRECGTEQFFELLQGPAHMMLPKLIDLGQSLDFVLVDGWHTFDYTLIDIFLMDQLLRPGGFMLIHDMNMASKKKAARYLRTHRKYKVFKGPKRSLKRRILAGGNQALHIKPIRGLMTFTTPYPMLVLKKTEHYEPKHDFYKIF